MNTLVIQNSTLNSKVGLDIYEKMTINNLKNLKTIVKLESPQKLNSSPCKHQCKDKSKCKHICCKSPSKVLLGEMKDNSPNKSNSKSPHFLMEKEKKKVYDDDDDDELDLPDEFFEKLESKESQIDSTQTWKQKYGISTTSKDVKFNTIPKTNLSEMNSVKSTKPIIPVTKFPPKVEHQIIVTVRNQNKSNIEISKPIIPVTKCIPKVDTPIIPVSKRNPLVIVNRPKTREVRNVEKKEIQKSEKIEIPKFEKASTLNSKKIDLGELKETLSKKGMNPNLLDLDFEIELDDCSDLINEFL
jgi:hypothetical protein